MIIKEKKYKTFQTWILSIGDGRIGGRNDGEATVEFEDDLLIPDSNDHIQSIIEAVRY